MTKTRRSHPATYLLLAYLAVLMSLGAVLYSSSVPDVKSSPPQTVLGAGDRPDSLRQAFLELFSSSR